MNPNIKCTKPCGQQGRYIWCHHDSGRYPYLKCEIYQQQMELDAHIQLNDIGLVRVINAKGEIE